jgi:hypothetical protein
LNYCKNSGDKYSDIVRLSITIVLENQYIHYFNFIYFSRSSIVERMPVLISNQTSNNSEQQQEQIYDQDDDSLVDGPTNHVTSNEPVVRNKLVSLI